MADNLDAHSEIQIPTANYPLPDEIRHDKDLDSEAQSALQQQWNLFNELRKKQAVSNPLVERSKGGQPELAKGTLIHGTTFSKDKLQKIKELGIVSGELIGIPEDTETNYCADFFKVPEDTGLEDYLKWTQEATRSAGGLKMKKPEFNYLPTPGKETKQIAFIIDRTQPEIQPLTQYDAYDPNGPEILKRIITQLPSNNSDRLSAILVGIPSNYINGIILGDAITPEETQEIKEIMGKEVVLYKTSGESIT